MTALRIVITMLAALFNLCLRRTPPADGRLLVSDTQRSDADEPRRVFVYIAGCKGLAELGRELGLAGVYKVGTTSNGDLTVRLGELGRDCYGASYRGADGRRLESKVFTRWVALAFAPSRAPRHRSITLLPRAIAVDLPSHLTPRAFDNALQGALVGRALQTVRPEAQRLTTYLMGDRQKPSATRELYAFEPRRDGNWLLDAVEHALSLDEPWTATHRSLRINRRHRSARHKNEDGRACGLR